MPLPRVCRRCPRPATHRYGTAYYCPGCADRRARPLPGRVPEPGLPDDKLPAAGEPDAAGTGPNREPTEAELDALIAEQSKPENLPTWWWADARRRLEREAQARWWARDEDD